jgi:hypothetical protein
MLWTDWAAYVHAALDPLADTTVTLVGGLLRVESFTVDAAAFYEITREEADQANADACIASIKADLGV